MIKIHEAHRKVKRKKKYEKFNLGKSKTAAITN